MHRDKLSPPLLNIWFFSLQLLAIKIVMNKAFSALGWQDKNIMRNSMHMAKFSKGFYNLNPQLWIQSIFPSKQPCCLEKTCEAESWRGGTPSQIGRASTCSQYSVVRLPPHSASPLHRHSLRAFGWKKEGLAHFGRTLGYQWFLDASYLDTWTCKSVD